MITIHKTANRISIVGHANAGPYGNDIVCAAVSMLAQNLIYSIQDLTDADIQYTMEPGNIQIQYEEPSEGTKLLIDFFFIGIEMLIDTYPEYIRLCIEETPL